MARVKRLTTLFILLNYAFALTLQVELMCEVANVKVESEDGRTQTFEMKRLESHSVKGESCSLCAFPAVNNAPELTALKSQLTLYISDKELSPDCGNIFLSELNCFYKNGGKLLMIKVTSFGRPTFTYSATV